MVLHQLCGKPLAYYVIKELKKLKCIRQIVVVVGHQGKDVQKALTQNFSGLEFVIQKKLLGTADAIKVTKQKVRCPNVLILCGDAPLITAKTLSTSIRQFQKTRSSVSVLSAVLAHDSSLGRIIRDKDGDVCAIRERIDIRGQIFNEVNSGIYCFKTKDLFRNLPKIKRNRKKGEYYLTDIIDILYRQNKEICTYCVSDPSEILGINSQWDLAFARKFMQDRILRQFMDKGIKIVDPANTYIEEGVKIGSQTTIFPFTYIENDVIIGSHCSLGPFIRVRKGTKVANEVYLGNFIEVNRSNIADSITMKHFGYLGDTTVGSGTNIGAGTVVANYDGKRKHKTVIGKNAFIGSDTVLRAPIKVGQGAVTGCGSVVTKNVAAKTVVVGVPARKIKHGKKRKG